MKTFLWTTLFWIIAAIAGLLCLGFGNLGTQVLDNEWMVKFLPHNVQSKICEPVLTSALEGIDWCAEAEAKNCSTDIQEDETGSLSGETARLQEPLSSIIANQEIIYSYLQESVASLNESIVNLQNISLQGAENSIIDEKEQQRLQLQAQIEALQAEISNL